MPGEFDPRYIRARSELLHALDALAPHHAGITLVGAQAVYIRTGQGNLAVTPFTEDGDLALDPALLANEPLLENAMTSAGFSPGQHPGSWISSTGVVVDLLVPSSLAGAGRRAARIPPHGRNAARLAKGLEAALVDRTVEDIFALDAADVRSHHIGVAGPSALLVAKAHKLGERVADTPARVRAKDALDVYRLLIAYDIGPLSDTFGRLLANGRARAATDEALTYLEEMFDERRPVGAELVADALDVAEDRSEVVATSLILVRRLLQAVRGSP